MGLTETGYTRKTYDEILEDKIAKAKELFGEDIETEENTPLGKYIRINAFDQAELEEIAEMIYYSAFPNTASGTSLDRLCPFVGITRNPASASQFTVEVTGTAGAEVPIGFLVGTESGITFYNTMTVTLDENGTGEIDVECTETGEIGNVHYSEIVQIINPDADITSVKGKAIITLGAEAESDYALRKRFEMAREGSGSCNESAIRASLLRVSTVTSAGVVVNDTDATDAMGRPPHSFECYVSGGENYHAEIAQMIYEKKPLGIKTYGNIAHTITDEAGNSHEIKFSHTAYIDIQVKVDIKTDATYEGETGRKEITDNITTYINGLGVGNPVILSSLYGRVHAVTGVKEVTNLSFSTDGIVYATNNIEVEEWEIARCVSVTVTEVS